MRLAKDEKIGLAIAALVGSLALASYAYRSTRGPSAPAKPVEPVHVVENDQAARDGYARLLADAFADDGNTAGVSADGTVLSIRWDMCSKQMLQRLLKDDQNFQVKNVREVAGLTVKRLKSHGFTRVVCDDGRKGLTPASTPL